MTYNFFAGLTNLNAVKAKYRELAIKHHPDHGGDTATMQAINAEYEQARQFFAGHSEKEFERRQAAAEVPGEYAEIVARLLSIQGIELELCGRWIWISGDTKSHKSELKAASCRWAPNKGMWYWRPTEEAAKHRGKPVDMEKIRETYGSSRITNSNDRERISAQA
jgi:hypothetical protein